MNKKLGIGIIGCSSIAKRVILPAINESKICKIERIGSRSKIKAKKTALDFHCKKFGNYDEVIEDRDVNIVYISLPIALQEYWIVKAAKAGKHILCEKSITTSLSSIKKIWNECKKEKVKILESFSYKYHPQHIMVQKILQKKEIGELRNFSSSFVLPISPSLDDFRFSRKLGGGILNDVGCYVINASRFFIKDEPLSITCKLFENKKYNIDTRGTIFLSFKNQKTAFGVIGYDKMFSSDYRIFCENGSIVSTKAYNIKKSEQTEIQINTKEIQRKKIIPEDQTKLMIEEFCKNINLKKINLSKEIINQGKVLEAARISNNKEKTVFLRDLK